MAKKWRGTAAVVLSAAMLATPVYAETANEVLLESESEEYVVGEEQEKADTLVRHVSEQTFQNLVLVETDALKVTASCVDTDPTNGYTWQLNLTNKTGDDLAVSISSSALNGSMVAPDSSVGSSWVIGALQSTQSELTFPANVLAQSHITSVSNVMFRLQAVKSGQFAQNFLVDQPIQVQIGSAEGETEGLIEETPEELSGENSQVLLDKDGVTAVVYGYEDSESGTANANWNMYLQNDTDHAVMFQLDDVVVNGYAVDNNWNQLVLPGMNAYVQVPMWTIDLALEGVQSVDDTRFNLEVWAQQEDAFNSYVNEQEAACVVTPGGETTAKAQEREAADTDIVLADTSEYKLILTKVMQTATDGFDAADFYMENLTKGSLSFSIDKISFGDRSVDTYWVQNLPSGSRKNAELSLAPNLAATVTDTAAEKIKVHVLIENENGELLDDQNLTVDLTKGSSDEKAEAVSEAVTEAEAVPASTEITTEAAPVTEAATETEVVTEATTEVQTEKATEASTEVQTEKVTEKATEAPTETEVVTEAATEAATEATTEAAEAETELKKYDDESTLRNVQNILQGQKYDVPDRDGIWGEKTYAAIKKYREDHNLAEGNYIADDLLFDMKIADAGTYKAMQTKLNELGYDCGEPDGLLGENTTKQINAYRKAEGLEGEGVDLELLVKLGLRDASEAELLNETVAKPEEAQTEEAKKEEAETEEAATEEAATEKTTEAESETEKNIYTGERTVRNVQATLYGMGYLVARDGKLDKLTLDSISKYRKDNNLPEGTDIDDEFLESMGLVNADIYQAIQEALNKAGYDVGTPDGLIGEKTTKAIEKYRKDKKLGGSGIDEKLLKAMGIK